mgnify:CR=1 FL=1
MTGEIKTVKGKDAYFLDGKRVSKKRFKKAFPDKPLVKAPGGHGASCWPQKMDALGCHPDDAAKHNESAAKAGLTGVHYDSDGFAVVADRNARKRLLKHEGCHDRDGGYSDG